MIKINNIDNIQLCLLMCVYIYNTFQKGFVYENHTLSLYLVYRRLMCILLILCILFEGVVEVCASCDH